MRRFILAVGISLAFLLGPIMAASIESGVTINADVEGDPLGSSESLSADTTGYLVRYYRTLGPDIGGDRRFSWSVGGVLERIVSDDEDMGANCLGSRARWSFGKKGIQFYGDGGLDVVITDRETVKDVVEIPDTDTISRSGNQTTESEIVGEIERSEAGTHVRYSFAVGLKTVTKHGFGAFAEGFYSDALNQGTLLDENKGIRVGVIFPAGS